MMPVNEEEDDKKGDADGELPSRTAQKNSSHSNTVKDSKKSSGEDAIVRWSFSSLYEEDEEKGLRRTLSLKNAITMTMGGVIGAGLFVAPTGVQRAAGSVGASIIIWFICGVWCFLGSCIYAELGIMIPKSGGDYAYLMEAFGPFLAFLRFWIEGMVVRYICLYIRHHSQSKYSLFQTGPGKNILCGTHILRERQRWPREQLCSFEPLARTASSGATCILPGPDARKGGPTGQVSSSTHAVAIRPPLRDAHQPNFCLNEVGTDCRLCVGVTVADRGAWVLRGRLV
ncbi:unnamed protein product [Cylicocyclus nassatus]|uniref:Uncharacterized protein n=1 Tax=Cylicocyclus nassatus TaxID=53992 RepID=A0AA36HE39_CYLNA|nr:unnamed protein product [Cylicocyclus nassatus]